MAISFQPSARPRIAIIDILRGFALYGIILAHTGTVYFMELGIDSQPLKPMDIFIKSILSQLIEKKFYLIFSFLFGLSFFIQLHNATAKNKPFMIKYIWRLSILFLIGWIHNQFYPFDILQIYAVIGLLLIPIRKQSALQLLSIAVILLLGSIFFDYYSEPIEATISLWQYGGTHLSPKLTHQIASGNFLAILSLFIWGFWAGKTKKFQALSINTRFFKRLFLASLIGVIVVKTIVALTTYLKLDVWIQQSRPFSLSILNICLSMFYTSFICLAHRYLPQINTLWRGLENIGRMGLTNYVAQTLFFFILFKLDIDLSEGGLLLLFALANLFFMGQLVYSTIWFKHFKMGPLEWFWRMATNLKWQSNRQSIAIHLTNRSAASVQEAPLANVHH